MNNAYNRGGEQKSLQNINNQAEDTNRQVKNENALEM